MGAALFYHLTEQPLEATLPVLLAKALDAGWRVELRGPDAALLGRLDDVLWTRPEDGFLPHGRAGGPDDAHQPILICGPGEAARNDPDCLMAVGGAEVAPAEAAERERVWILFDGHDPAAVARARDQWRQLTSAGCAAQYWAQDGGRWVKKSESGAG